MPRGNEHEPRMTWSPGAGWRKLEPPPEAIAESQFCEPFSEQRLIGEQMQGHLDGLEMEDLSLVLGSRLDHLRFR